MFTASAQATPIRSIRTSAAGCIVAVVAAACGASLAAAQCPNPSWNGYCPETAVRPGEVPIWQQQYKASHNSYDRSEDLNDQIDDYNCWMLELDCWWLDGDIHVRHLCSGANGPTLSEKLTDIAASLTATQRFTFIYLELKYDCTNDNCECGFGETCYAWPDSYRTTFKNQIQAILDPNRIYAADEWDSIDVQNWPSAQELVRRGKNFAIILHERCTGDGGNDFFFEVTGSGSGFDTLRNYDGGCDGGGSPDPADPSPWFLYRAYPSAGCSGLCSEQDGGFWEDGTSLGYTFIATNCVDNDHTFNYAEVHSPMPYYVVNSGTYDHSWGTLAFPQVGSFGLFFAFRGVSPMVDVQVSPGTYVVTQMPFPFPNGPHTIDRPMVLKNRTGAGEVVIR